MPTAKTTELEFTPKQQEFADAVLSGVYRYLLMGGGIRGGKSFGVLALVVILAKMFPRSRWAIVRKDLPTLRRNTIPTFEKIRPRGFVGDINQSTWSAKCANGSELIFFPATFEHDKDLNRWRGLEVNGFVLEEANELNEDSFNKAIERAGSWVIQKGEQPPPYILMTCNPTDNWVKQQFYNKWKAGTLQAPFYYLQSLIADNPHLPDSYIQSLESLKTTNPKAYKRFVQGDWEMLMDPDQLIDYEWLINARNVEHIAGEERIGIDVARYGNDDTVFAQVNGNKLYRVTRHHGLSIDRTAEIGIALVNEKGIKAENVLVDTDGLGAGVADIMKRQGFKVTEIVGGAKTLDRNINSADKSFYKFKNFRSQIHWELRERLRNGEICIDIDDPKLFEDLTAPRYSVDGEKLLKIESKDEIKQRIGRSPDAGDAVFYVFANAQPIKKQIVFC